MKITPFYLSYHVYTDNSEYHNYKIYNTVADKFDFKYNIKRKVQKDARCLWGEQALNKGFFFLEMLPREMFWILVCTKEQNNDTRQYHDSDDKLIVDTGNHDKEFPNFISLNFWIFTQLT